MAATHPKAVLPALFPTGVTTSEGDPAAMPTDLFPEEQALVAQAHENRRKDFAAGRACARRALERLGVAPASLPSGPRGYPAWPDGLIGSVAHTHGYCGAAVAFQRDFRSLGLDIERIDRLKEPMWRRICTPDEVLWLESTPDNRRLTWAALLFSAKECFYKWQYPLSHVYLGFRQVTLRVDVESSTFRVERCPLAEVEKVEGRWTVRGNHVFTGIAL